MAKILQYVLALARTVAGGAAIEGDAIVVSAGPRVRGQPGCPACGRRRERHDHEPTRRRGAMDLARPECSPGHGPGHTRDLGDWVACPAAGCRAPAHSRVARVGWHGVGGVCGRACDETGAQGGASRLGGPRRIGIDETGHERGHKHPAVVVDHDRGCLARARGGYGKEVLGLLLDEPARERRRAMGVAAADGARWTEAPAGRGCPNARRVMGPSRVAGWASDAPDGAGREGRRVAKGAAQDAMPGRDGPGRPRRGEEAPPGARAPGEAADATRGSRCALAGNPEDLTGSRRERPAEPGRAGASSRPGTSRRA